MWYEGRRGKYVQVFYEEDWKIPPEAIWQYNAKFHLKEIRWSRLDWLNVGRNDM